LDKPPSGFKLRGTTIGERVYRKRLPWHVVKERLLQHPSFRKNKEGGVDWFRTAKSLVAQPNRSGQARIYWPPWTLDTASSPY
jgi:hypothetical protein